uniref:DDE_3 domain-containing protein n=1 Tax=Bursaphelenchus xylophilus TaxID=6326 RepID=A0A1I7RIM5_BURXY
MSSERGAILTLFRSGKRQCDIVRMLGVPKQTVSKAVKRFRELGHDEKVVLPWSAEHFGQRRWTFQQDSAPAHSSKSTQDWIRAHFPDFIPSKEWPPYSPDLNPLDYSIWSILEARSCSKPHDNIESLKASLIKEWKRLTAEEVRAAALNFTERLKLCVGAQGGHFETT